MRVRLALLTLVLSTACATAPPPRPTEPPLDQFIRSAIATPPFTNALWGIRIEEEDRTVLFDQNSQVLMMPASNRKAYVGALAAECLGLDSTLTTELWADGPVAAGVLRGNLVLKGGGDPSLGGRYDEDRDRALLPLLEAIRARGITSVEGSVVGDASLYSRETIPGAWKTDNLGATYAAPVDALTFNENVVGVTIRGAGCEGIDVITDPSFAPTRDEIGCGGPPLVFVNSGAGNVVAASGVVPPALPVSISDIVAITEPALYGAQAFTDFLARHGVAVRGAPGVNVEPRSWAEKLGEIESPTIFHLLTTVLKNSQNLYAEMLFRNAAGGPGPISYADARKRERDFLVHEVGLDPLQFRFDDGSGLSVENMVTPASSIRLFRYLWEPPRRHIFFALLATPGESGTLRRRLAGLEQRMRGKTGTIDGVEALSGYVLLPDGRPRFFSIMVNHHIGGEDDPEVIIDQIVQRIAR